MSGDCCECVMTLTLRLTLTMSLTSREHQQVTRTGVTRGGRWQETQLWQRAGHRIRLQQRQSPWTTTRKQHNWHCAPQVPCQCPGPQHPGLCVWSWLIWKYLQSENMINCLLSGLHHHSYPSVEFLIPSYPWMTGHLSFELLLLGLTWKFSPFSSEKMNAKRRKSIELFWIRDLIKFKHVVHFSLD